MSMTNETRPSNMSKTSLLANLGSWLALLESYVMLCLLLAMQLLIQLPCLMALLKPLVL